MFLGLNGWLFGEKKTEITCEEHFPRGVFSWEAAPCSSTQEGISAGKQQQGLFFLLGMSLSGGRGWRVATAICR